MLIVSLLKHLQQLLLFLQGYLPFHLQLKVLLLSVVLTLVSHFLIPLTHECILVNKCPVHILIIPHCLTSVPSRVLFRSLLHVQKKSLTYVSTLTCIDINFLSFLDILSLDSL